MIAVIGATGKIGGEAVKALRRKGAAFRCIVRDPEAAAGKLGPDVDLVEGDLSDPIALRSTLRGMERLFLVCGLDPMLARLEINAIEAAGEAGVSHVVKSSAAWPMIEPHSPTEVGRQHLEVECALEASGLEWTILRPSFLMQNSLSQASRVANESRIALPVPGDAVVGMVDTEDVGACAAEALTGDGHAGRTYHLTGAAITFAEVAAAFSRVLGREIRLDVVPEAQARSNMNEARLPDWMIAHFLGIGRLLSRNELAEVTGDVEAILGRAPRDVAHYVEKNAAAFGG